MARKFGKYVIVEEIARGGMGVVYKARHPALDKTVALKTLLEAHESSRTDVNRFMAEAKAAAKLRHPGIVTVHDVGISGGLLYFTMDFIEGTDLKEIIERRTVSNRLVAEILENVARALHYAHGQGIIHRDVKPANILIDRSGAPYVTDFGLAVDLEKQAAGGKGPTVGTPEYMSPEQAKAGEVDHRTDVYSMGATLYKALTGRPVFEAQTLLKLWAQIQNADPRPPSRYNRNLDRDLETICLKCLEKSPDRRYDSAEALADDLDRWRKGEPIQARPPGFFESMARKARRHRWALVGILLAATLTVAVATVVSRQSRAEARAAKVRLSDMQRRLDLLETMDLDRMIADLEKLARSADRPEDRHKARDLLAAFRKRRVEKGPDHGPAQDFKEALAFRRAHPDRPLESRALFRRIAEAYPTSPQAESAASEIERIEGEILESAAHVFHDTLRAAQPHIDSKRYDLAVQAWEEALPRLGTTYYQPKASTQIRDIIDLAWRRFTAQRRQARRDMEQGRFDVARDALNETLSYGFPAIEAVARIELREVARLEEAARAKQAAHEEADSAATRARILERLHQNMNRSVDRAFDRLVELDVAGARDLLVATSEEPGMDLLTAEMGARVRGFTGVLVMWNEALRRLRRAAASRGKIDLLIGKPDADPVSRNVTIIGVGDDRIQVETMGAKTAVAFKELHPLGWVSLAGGDPDDPNGDLSFGSGVFLGAFGCHDPAARHLRAAKRNGEPTAWAQARFETQSGSTREAQASRALAGIRELAEGSDSDALSRAIRDFRERFGDTATARDASDEIDVLARSLERERFDLSQVISGRCRSLGGDGWEMAYPFSDRRDLDDWHFTRSVIASRAVDWQTSAGRVTLEGTAVRHGLDLTGDMELNLEVLLPEDDVRWAVAFQGVFLLYLGGGAGRFEVRKGPHGERLAEQRARPLKDGAWIPVRVIREGGAVRIRVGKREEFTATDPLPGPGPVEIHGISGKTSFRNIRLAGTVDIETARQEARFQRLVEEGQSRVKSVPWHTIFPGARGTDWHASPEGAWKSDLGGLLALANSDQDTHGLSSRERLYNGSLDARFRFEGEGRCLLEVRSGEGRAYFWIPPWPGWRRFQADLFGPAVRATLDGVPLHPDRKALIGVPGSFRFSLIGKGTLSVKQVRFKPDRDDHLSRDRWTGLFDGTSLSGWFVEDRQHDRWHVEDGALVGRDGDKWAWLRSQDAYGNIRLNLKVKGISGEAPRIAVRWHSQGHVLVCPPPDGQWHKVEIFAKASQVAAIVDGRPAPMINTDPDRNTRALGSIMLGVRNGTAAFKDVVVKSER